MTTPSTFSNCTEKQAKSQDNLLWQQVREIFSGFEQAAFTRELSTVLANLHDEELLEALEETRWTGRPGYPIRVIWKTLIASYVRDIPTIQELIRTLNRDPILALQCGIHSDKEVPRTRVSHIPRDDVTIDKRPVV